jgi:hypothetical protein
VSSVRENQFAKKSSACWLCARGQATAFIATRHVFAVDVLQSWRINVTRPKFASIYYEAIGDTVDAAIEKAHAQIPPRQGRDFVVSRVIELGMQRGGFTGAKAFYARGIEDENANFKT